MNVKAWFELNGLIAEWSQKHELEPAQEIELVKKQLGIMEQAELVAAMGWDPEKEVERDE